MRANIEREGELERAGVPIPDDVNQEIQQRLRKFLKEVEAWEKTCGKNPSLHTRGMSLGQLKKELDWDQGTMRHQMFGPLERVYSSPILLALVSFFVAAEVFLRPCPGTHPGSDV